MQKREDSLFHNVKDLMLELMDWRRQILAKALPGVCSQFPGNITEYVSFLMAFKVIINGWGA